MFRDIVERLGRIGGGFLKRGLDHADRAQTSLLFCLHGRYKVFLQLIENWHVFDILKTLIPFHAHSQATTADSPGPTPLYPPALHAMMASDIHHRTEEFRNVYKAALADLKEVYGTSNDVLCFAASGTGAMDASVSNLFSQGDKVIVRGGKFSERWVEIARAYGLDATVLKAEYGDVVTPDRIESALKAEPATKGDVHSSHQETSTGAEHDVETIAGIVGKTNQSSWSTPFLGLGFDASPH